MPQFFHSNRTLSTSPRGTYEANQPLANITIMGVTEQPKEVKFKGEKHHGCWTWDNASLVLKVIGLGGMTKEGAFSEGWELEWN